MLNGIDLKNKKMEFKALLYKNSRELIGEIPQEFIKGITYKFEECDEIDIEVPKYIMSEIGNKKILNPLYNKIDSRKQVVINSEYRFVLIDKSTTTDRKSGTKRFKGYSMEKTLEKRRVAFEGIQRQLYRGNDQVEIGEGILDVFEVETGWKVATVTENARKEQITTVETEDVNLYTNYSKENIANGTVLFEKDVNIIVGADEPLIMEVNYLGFKTINTEGKTLLNETISNTIEALHLGIKKIKCTYDTTQVNNRFSVNYEFTFTDDTTKIVNIPFRNVTGMNITADSIFIKYQTNEYKPLNLCKYRYFESVDTNWLDFLRDEVQQAYNVIFFFDTVNKTISAYSRDEVGELSKLYLSYDSCIQEATRTEINDEMCTRLKIISSNNISINSENILGTDYVECFDYLIRKGTLSEELKQALDNYNIVLEAKQVEWLTLTTEKATLNNKQIQLSSEIKTLGDRIKVQNDLLTVYMTNGQEGYQMSTKLKIEELQARVEVCLASLTETLTRLNEISDEMYNIAFSIQKENVEYLGEKIFNEDLLDEYNTEHIIESTYNDSFYTTEYGLYNYAKEYVKELNEVQIDFSLTLDNLNKAIRDKKGFEGIINLGDFAIVGEKELSDEINDFKIRLVEYRIIPSENCRLDSVAFSSREKQKQALKSVGNLGKKTANNTNLTGKYKGVWENSIGSNNFVTALREGGLNLASQIASGGGTKNRIQISEAGVFISDQENNDLQTYIGSNLYAISTDGFKTSSVAIMPEGINATMLISKVVISEKLFIGNEENTFTIDPNGLTIRDGGGYGEGVDRVFLGIQEVNGVKKAMLRLIGANGELCLTEDGIISQNQFVAWDNVSSGFPMRIPYVVDEGVVSCKRVLLTLILEKYRAFERGVQAGGTVSSTESGGGSTATSSSGGGDYISSTMDGDVSVTSDSREGLNAFTGIPEDSLGTDNWGNHIHRLWISEHSHSVQVPSHSHNLTISAHTHGLDIPNHQHSINLNHTHSTDFAIYEEDSLPTNVKVYVNNVLVQDGINTNAQVDITNKIILNSTNNIRIESDTNGRITCNLFAKTFVAF